MEAKLLPDFDIRLRGRNEFQDYDLSSPGTKQNALQNVAAVGAVHAVDTFRVNLGSGEKLRALVNETGAIKNIFIEGGPLASAQPGTPDTIARNFLKQHTSLFRLSRGDVANLKLTKQDTDRGTTFLTYVQRVHGVKVFEGEVQVVVNSKGEILSVREGFLITDQTINLTSGLSEVEALSKAFEYSGKKVDSVFIQVQAQTSDLSAYANPLGSNFENVFSELVVVRVNDSARLAWHVYTEVGPIESYEVLVDAATGDLLFRNNLCVSEAQGTVFTVHPDSSVRQLVSFVGNTTINTSAGWMETSMVTTGNNVDAYLDTDANNAADPNNGPGLSNGHAFSSSQDFTFPFSTAVDPRTQQAAVVTNLFYFNNVMHDFSYGLGFTETAGNFQTNNFGRGGVGNDSVIAEAQDGSGFNNANFRTLPDGIRSRMQQYLFQTASPVRDSSVDSDVVFHEYGHGISNRLIGNGGSALAGIQSGALGEGWSDYWALTLNNNGVMAEYSTRNPIKGIRRAAYTVPADTVHDSYADLLSDDKRPHPDGEVWAATLWDLRTQLGATITDRLVLNGMKFTPSRPSFLAARDGILQADQNLNAGANRCVIWTVFARHGMGVSAVGNDGPTHIAATDTPSDCGGGSNCASTPVTIGQTLNGILTTTDCRYPTGSNWYSDAYSFNGTAGQQVAIAMSSSSFDTWLALISPTGSELTIDNDGGGGTNSRIPATNGFYTLPSSGTYLIQASSNLTNATGSYTLSLSAPPSGVPNDNFANAQIINGSSGTVTGNNIGTTKESGEPNHVGISGGASVWYRWTAPASGSVTMTTAGSNFDTLLAVYTGSSVNALTSIASNDDASPSDLSSRVTFNAVAGTIYRIAVDGFFGATGSIVLNWNSLPVGPANNNFVSAQTITGNSGSVGGNNANASKEAGEPNHGGDSGGVSVWYVWQAPGSGTMTINTVGSNFDTLLGVYTGSSVSNLTTIASNDDESFPSTLTSRVTFNAVVGTTYRLAVDGFNGGVGNIVLNWSQSVPPSQPTANAATNVTGNSFTSNWSSSSTATGYRLDVSTSNSFSNFVSGYNNLDVGSVLGRNITGLSAGTTYYYRVRAYNTNGTSGNSGTITVTTTVNPPNPPAANTATNVASNSFTSNWSSSVTATGYRLDVSTSSSFSSFVSGYNNLDVGNVLSRSVSGLSAGTTYYYRVRAYNNGGTSGNSNSVSLTTSSPPSMIFIELGTTNRAAALDAVTLLRGPFRVLNNFNFHPDRHTRVIIFTSNHGLTLPDSSILTVRAAGLGLTVEGVGPVLGVTGMNASYIVVRLPDGLPSGDLPLTVTLRGVASSNSPTLSISQ